MRKVFILDTSVLIHDPESVLKFKDNDVYIPLDVIKELDKLKNKHDLIGDNVRYVINLLDTIDNPNIHIYTKFSNINGNTTTKIVDICRKLKEEIKDKSIILVTRNAAMRIMARAFGITVEDYRSDNVDALPTCIYTIQSNSEFINKLYNEKQVPFEYNKGCYVFKYGSMSALAYCSNNVLKLVQSRNDTLITPKDVYQTFYQYFLYNEDVSIIACTGAAGSGKTYMAVGAALDQLGDNKFKKILLLKPTIPIGNDIGYLPGEKEEKLSPWLQSYVDNLSQFGLADYFSNKIEIEAITYLRGRTLANMFIICDEATNLTPKQIKTILSRVGKNSKIIFLGDLNQIDNPYLSKTSNGLSYLIHRLFDQDSFVYLELKNTHRSQIAKMADKLL